VADSRLNRTGMSSPSRHLCIDRRRANIAPFPSRPVRPSDVDYQQLTAS
jgi:hypothetical protein